MKKSNVGGLSQFAVVKEEVKAPAVQTHQTQVIDERKKNKDNRIGVTVRLREDDWEWLSEHSIKTRESLQKMALKGFDLLLKSRGLRGLKEIDDMSNQ
jgi:hypothetical protein